MLLYNISKKTSVRSLVLILFTLFVGCSFTACKQPKNDAIKNNIKIHEDGLHIEKAFLTNGDSIEINDDNKVYPGERVCLRISITGFKEKNNKIFFDASQKVTTSKGVTLTENPSMFGASMVVGTLPQDAKHILLYETMGRLDKPAEYILISFKVWDQLNKNSVSGSYKLYM